MAAKEKQEGHWAEGHSDLHDWMSRKLGYKDVRTLGHTGTKTDIIADSTRFSCKYPSGTNTQIHLTTLRRFSELFRPPADVAVMLERWLGNHDEQLFEEWSRDYPNLSREELRRHRIHSDKFADWNKLLEWFNDQTKNGNLIETLITSLNGEPPVEKMLWINKKKGYLKLIDVNKLLSYCKNNCEWVNSPDPRGAGTTLWLYDRNKGTRIIHLQMKGSGNKMGDYHGMMFHIHETWPEDMVLDEETDFWLR